MKTTEKKELHEVAERASEEPISSERSWTLFALLLAVVLVVVDLAIASIGSQLFWSERVVYVGSVISRAAVVLIASFSAYQRVLSDVRTLYTVTITVAGLSGLALAVLRFVQDSSFWTFLNLVVEPVDAAILAVAAGYIVHQLTLSRGASRRASA